MYLSPASILFDDNVMESFKKITDAYVYNYCGSPSKFANV